MNRVHLRRSLSLHGLNRPSSGDLVLVSIDLLFVLAHLLHLALIFRLLDLLPGILKSLLGLLVGNELCEVAEGAAILLVHLFLDFHIILIHVQVVKIFLLLSSDYPLSVLSLPK